MNRVKQESDMIVSREAEFVRGLYTRVHDTMSWNGKEV